MPLPTYYNSGIATVNSGETVITFASAFLGSEEFPTILPGDLFMDPAQPDVPPQRISSIDYAGLPQTATLAFNWPGTSMVAADYEIRLVGFVERSTAQTRRYLEMLGQLSNLGIQPNAFGQYADRDDYDAEAAGFIYLSLNGDAGVTTTAWTLYIKETGDPADWDAGQSMEGAEGPTGPSGQTILWYVGAGVPSGGLGSNGDMYLRSNGDVYGPKSGGAWGAVSLNLKGLQGDPGLDGADGADGADGIDGTDPGVLFTWDDVNTDADPGAGNVRADSDALGSAGFLYVSKTNRVGDDVSAWLLDLASSTAAVKANIVLTRNAGNAQATFNLTGVTDATGYVKLAVTSHGGATGFLDTNSVSLQVYKTGDDGTGAVNSVNGESGSVILSTDDISDSGQTNKWATAAEKAKLGFVTVTQAVDLDAIESRVNALDAAVILKGSWDASAGTFPGGGTAQAGESYIVSVAGTVNSVAFAVNDRIIAITDNASTTTFNANWFKADYTDQVLSVAALTGAITAAGLKTALAIAVADITDATANGRSLISSANYASMRALLDLEAGTDFYSISAANAAFQAIDAQLSSLIRQNSQSAAYTLVLTDGGKHIYHPAADTTARIWTIPSNASVAFPIGTVVTFDNDFGAGAITIAITTDTLVLVGTAGGTGSRTLASGGQATAIKVTSTRWRISGVGLT